MATLTEIRTDRDARNWVSMMTGTADWQWGGRASADGFAEWVFRHYTAIGDDYVAPLAAYLKSVGENPDDYGLTRHQGPADIRPHLLLPASEGRWESPESGEVREALRLAGWSMASAALHLGVHRNTVKQWRSGAASIGYPAWRLLIQAAGIAQD